MTLSRIVMRLARNPGTEFAGGDDHRGYALTAPLSDDGHLDEAAYGKTRDKCVVRRFAPDEDPGWPPRKRGSAGSSTTTRRGGDDEPVPPGLHASRSANTSPSPTRTAVRSRTRS
jgi:hypothetical protein